MSTPVLLAYLSNQDPISTDTELCSCQWQTEGLVRWETFEVLIRVVFKVVLMYEGASVTTLDDSALNSQLELEIRLENSQGGYVRLLHNEVLNECLH